MYLHRKTGFPKRILTEEHCSPNGPSGETGEKMVFHANPHRKTRIHSASGKNLVFHADSQGKTEFALQNPKENEVYHANPHRKTGYTKRIIRGKRSLPCGFSKENKVYPRFVRRNTRFRVCLAESQGKQGLPITMQILTGKNRVSNAGQQRKTWFAKQILMEQGTIYTEDRQGWNRIYHALLVCNAESYG